VIRKTNYLVFLLAIGVFSIVNTQLGVIGILPLIAEHFQVSISKAGMMVSLFALAAAVSGPTMPLLFSGVNRKTAMLLALGAFAMGNIVSAFASSFIIALIAYVLPAIFLPTTYGGNYSSLGGIRWFWRYHVSILDCICCF